MEIERDLIANRASLRAWAHRLTPNPADADDLVQDTLERALRAAAGLEGGSDVAKWLRTILFRRFIDVRRTRSREVVVDTGWFEGVPRRASEPLPWWRVVDDEEIARALVHVPSPYRETYTMFVEEDRTYAEIAAHFGVDTATVGSRIARARSHLRTIVHARRDSARHARPPEPVRALSW